MRQQLEVLPNLIIAGVSKGGTTSLFAYLSQHPDICPSDIKEVRYFSPLRYGQPLQPLSEYHRHFTQWKGESLVMEATPGYFYGGERLATGLLQRCPDARVVVALRAPEQRCWSWFRFVKSRARIPRTMTFDGYLDRCEELHARGVDESLDNQPFWGLGGGCYDQWYPVWSHLFGDRLRVVYFEHLISEPQEVVQDICTWAGVDSAPVSDFDFSAENQTRQYRNQAVQKAALLANRRAEAFFHRHRKVKRTLRGIYLRTNGAAGEDAMSETARRRMSTFYRPHVEHLTRL